VETVFVGHADGTLSALDVSDGRALWETTVGRGDDFVDVDADVIYEDGVVYAAGFRGGLHALDPLSGATLWSAPVDAVNRMTSTAHHVVVAGPRQVALLDKARGAVRWRFSFPEGSASRPVVHRGRVLVNTDRGGLYVLNFTDGRPLQYYGGRPGFTGAPAAWRDSLFLLSNGGWLHALSDRFAGVLAAQRAPW
jgi:outer membrane protein assembly factor BamB